MIHVRDLIDWQKDTKVTYASHSIVMPGEKFPSKIIRLNVILGEYLKLYEVTVNGRRIFKGPDMGKAACKFNEQIGIFDGFSS